MHAWIGYYTGTGNTARALGLVAEALRAEGWTVNCAEVKCDGPVPSASVLGAADLVVLGCPTLGFSAPSHFLRWLGRWPRSAGTRAAVLGICGAYETKGSVAGGYPGMSVFQVAGRLKRRGFRVTNTAAASYGDNWTQVTNPPDGPATDRINLAADPGIRAFAAALAEGRAQTLRLPAAGTVLSSVVAFLFRLVARRFFGKVYVADASCTACGLCVRTCPAGTIRLKNGRPLWGLDCDACNRCINVCPTRSIQVSAVRLVVHGGGNLALTVAAVVLIGPWGWGPALGLFAGATLVQLTVLEAGLRALERWPAARRLLAWGWTPGFRRYRAPGFRP